MQQVVCSLSLTVRHWEAIYRKLSAYLLYTLTVQRVVHWIQAARRTVCETEPTVCETEPTVRCYVKNPGKRGGAVG